MDQSQGGEGGVWGKSVRLREREEIPSAPKDSDKRRATNNTSDPNCLAGDQRQQTGEPDTNASANSQQVEGYSL